MRLRGAVVAAGLFSGCARLCTLPGTHQHGAYEQVRHSEKCAFETATVAWVWVKCPSIFGDPRGQAIGQQRTGH